MKLLHSGKVKKIGTRSIVSACSFAFVLLLTVASAGAQDPYAGKLKAYESNNSSEFVRIIRIGYSGLLAVKAGDAVFVGDTVKTGNGVKGQIELSDGTVMTLAPNSTVQIKGYLLDKEQGKRNAVMKALKGTIRLLVAKIFGKNGNGSHAAWKDSQVTVETLNAVAGVRGTDFFTITGPNETEFAVIEGAVNVRSSTLSQRGAVTLGGNQSSSVKTGGNPTPPASLSPERITALVDATTMKNPVTSSGNSNGTAKKVQYDEKDVARDLASGLPIGTILDKAVEAGLTIEGAIEAALNAGASPSGLVYTAIIEGYPANKVVEAAVGNGAPLSIVLSSALAAGADKLMVVTGAADAGVPPAAIASTMASVVSGGPVVGGTTPDPVSPSTIAPGMLPVIGGGGGATPSTRPASPYKP